MFATSSTAAAAATPYRKLLPTFSDDMMEAASLIAYDIVQQSGLPTGPWGMDAAFVLMALGDQVATVAEDETLSAAASVDPSMTCPTDWRHGDGHTCWVDDCIVSHSNGGIRSVLSTVSCPWRPHLPLTAAVIYALRRGVAGKPRLKGEGNPMGDEGPSAATEIYHQMLYRLSSYRRSDESKDLMLPPVTPFGVATLVRLLISVYGAHSDAIFGPPEQKKAIIHHIGENWSFIETLDDMKTDDGINRGIKHHNSILNAVRVMYTVRPRDGWVQPLTTTAEVASFDITMPVVHIGFLRDHEANIAMHAAAKGGHAELIRVMCDLCNEFENGTGPFAKDASEEGSQPA